MKITRQVREAVKNAVACTNYDVDTIVIHRDGIVSAVRDADKTFNGPETDRLMVGYVQDLVGSGHGEG